MIHRNCRVKIIDIYKVSECDIKQYILQTNSFFKIFICHLYNRVFYCLEIGSMSNLYHYMFHYKEIGSMSNLEL